MPSDNISVSLVLSNVSTEWIDRLLEELVYKNASRPERSRAEENPYLYALEVFSATLCTTMLVITCANFLRTKWNSRQKYNNPNELLRYYSKEAAECMALEKYYSKKVTNILGRFELNLTNPCCELEENKFLEELKSKHPKKKVEKHKIEAIKNWVLSYFEIHKVFNLNIYEKHMGDYGVEFEQIKTSLTNKDWDRINKVIKDNKSNCDPLAFLVLLDSELKT